MEPQHRAYRGESDDLPGLPRVRVTGRTLSQAIDLRGMGNVSNVAEPLRVVRELRPKLATIQARWPELQVEEKEEAIRF